MNNKVIPYGKQDINDSDVKAVIEVLNGEYLTQGPAILEFEKAFSNYVGSKYSIALSNGTAALHLSLLALDIKPNDKVITTPITFAASANCIRYCGGEVVFCDIEKDSYLIDLVKLEQMLSSVPIGTYKAVIPVDFAGRPVNLERLRFLADKYKFKILQDSCHSPGGFFTDSNNVKQSCGNGIYADLSIFSFHPVKHITSGEGGMITTNDPLLYDKLLMLRSHGITRDKDKFLNSKELAIGSSTGNLTEYPGWYMEMQILGFNYRLTDLQAALGLSQLKRAEQGVNKRRDIAKKYNDAFSNKDFIKGQSGIIEGHAYHLYIIEVNDNRLGLYNYLKKNNIYAQIHYIPCHLMPYYQDLGYSKGDFPVAENYYTGCLSLPMYPTLTVEEQDYVINTVFDFYDNK